MWFNSTQRAEPYQLLTCPVGGREIGSVSSAGRDTGAAWLSSARVVRCWVKSRNERNPHLQLPSGKPGTLQKLPVTSRRKAGMTSSPHGPYGLGYTRATMAVPGGGRRAHLHPPRSPWELPFPEGGAPLLGATWGRQPPTVRSVTGVKS